MKNFIFGCIFIGFIIPIMHGLVTVIEQIFQYLYNIFYLKTAIQEQSLKETLEEAEKVEPPINTSQIGFQIDSTREEEYVEEDEEDK